MREPGVATTPEEGSGRLRRLSERSSTDNENTWEMVEADQSYVETAAQVRPLNETTLSSEIQRRSTVDLQTEQSDGEWVEIDSEHINVSLMVCHSYFAWLTCNHSIVYSLWRKHPNLRCDGSDLLSCSLKKCLVL